MNFFGAEDFGGAGAPSAPPPSATPLMLSLTADFGSKDISDPGSKHLKILHPNRKKIPCGSYASEMKTQRVISDLARGGGDFCSRFQLCSSITFEPK